MPNTPEHYQNYIAAQLPADTSIEQLVAINECPLRASFRVNTLKADAEQCRVTLEQRGYKLQTIPWCENGYWLNDEIDSTGISLGNSDLHLQGKIYIQEASSMLPVKALLHNSSEPNMVLDMAAAPGSKTTQLSAAMNNSGLILANEYSASRIKGLFANIQRCRNTNVVLSHFAGQQLSQPLQGVFDAVLLDAPCSGEGTVRKDPEAFKNWSEQSVNNIAATQRELIVAAFQTLKRGGILIYSTCTLNKTENQHVCQHLLDTFPDDVVIESLGALFAGAERATTPEGYLHVWPHYFDSEGFFIARFKKTGVQPLSELSEKFKGKFPFAAMEVKASQLFLRDLQSRLGLDLSPLHQRLWQRDDEVWIFPEHIQRLIGRVKMDRPGIKIAVQHRSGWRYTHELAINFGHQATNWIELTAQQASEYVQGKDIYPDDINAATKECILCYQQIPLGLAKVVGSRLKNNLPRELVRSNACFSEI